MYTVFLVEDDSALATTIKKHLESWDYQVITASQWQNVAEEALAAQPHLVLMDIMLPFYDGYYWCREIRKSSNLPIVFLSSASDAMNLVMAIHMGGDDFVAKPFDAMVLLAKVQAVLRRCYDMTERMPALTCQGVTLYSNDLTLSWEGGTIALTKNEYRILETLFANRGKVVSRDTLMTKLWQDDCYVEENTLTVNVTRLRKKLEEIGLGDFIKTKVGLGYLIQR